MNSVNYVDFSTFFYYKIEKEHLLKLKKRTYWLKLEKSSRENLSLGPTGHKAAGNEVRDVPVTLESALASFCDCSCLLHSTSIAELWKRALTFLFF